jgi:hypothetical protein
MVLPHPGSGQRFYDNYTPGQKWCIKGFEDVLIFYQPRTDRRELDHVNSADAKNRSAHGPNGEIKPTSN